MTRRHNRLLRATTPWPFEEEMTLDTIQAYWKDPAPFLEEQRIQRENFNTAWDAAMEPARQRQAAAWLEDARRQLLGEG